MYNKIKLSIFLVAIMLIGNTIIANSAQDNAPLAGDTQMQNEEIDHAQTTSQLKPVYLVVQHTVPDVESYTNQYLIPVSPQLKKIGVKVLAASSEPQILEGKGSYKSMVIIEFPSMSVAKKWYSSEEYKPYKDIRINKLTKDGNLVLVPGFAH